MSLIAKKTYKKQEQSTSIVDPLAYVAHTTSAPVLSSPSTPSPQPTAQSPSDALMATMNQIANLLSGFQKQFPPTNNTLDFFSTPKLMLTDDGVRGKKVICYNCRGEGHVARHVKNPKRKMDLELEKIKLLLKKPKEKGSEAYDSDVDEGPNAAVAFMANLSSTSATNNQVNETEIDTIRFRSTYLLDTASPKFPTEVILADTSDKISMIAILTDLQTPLDGHAKDLLQRLTCHTNIPSSKKPKAATADLHKDLLGTRNPGLGYMAKRAQPVLYDADTLFHPTHHPVSIWDSEEVLVHQVVSMKKMNEKPGHVRPENGFYEKLNALKFVPQKELSGDQAYWLSANEIASQASKPATPPFVHKSRPPSQVLASLRNVNAVFPQFEGIIKERTTQKPDYVSEWCFDYAKQFVEQQLLRQQLQGKDDTIRNLDAQINIMKDVECRIQLDGLKVENVSLKKWFDELSKANTPLTYEYTEKLSAFTAENTKLKAQVTGTTSSGPSTSEKPKVLASGMYTNSSKGNPRTSNRPTQKPPVQQNKKPNVPVNLSTRTKPATESRKPMPKSHTWNHHILPNKSVNARRAAYHNRKLNVVDHNQFVIRSLKSVNTKTPQAKHSVNHTKQVWKATRNHNVNTTKTAWRPTRKVVGSVKPQWKPTGRHFALYDNCPLTRIMEPIVEPLELTPSVSSSSKVTMISRFTDCKLSDRKAGSKGLSGIF
ncbi:hypothetical protein Tco_1429252 [Tanacetum coccineum]